MTDTEADVDDAEMDEQAEVVQRIWANLQQMVMVEQDEGTQPFESLDHIRTFCDTFEEELIRKHERQRLREDGYDIPEDDELFDLDEPEE